MHLPQGYHLTYCTNIHPGESWAEVFRNLSTYLPPLKQQLSPNKPFGIGLRLSNHASKELQEQQQLQKFNNWLQQQGLYVFTINGFPYGGFHHQEVKDKVHSPDWTSAERRDYTIRLAHILAELLPEGMEGSISTSPITYKPWQLELEEAKIKHNHSQALEHLLQVIKNLVELQQRTGKTLHLDLEPEPDGLLENSDEVIHFFEEALLPQGTEYLQRHLQLNTAEAEAAIRRHLQLCYDVCHFALAYEQPAETFTKLQAAGIKVGKIQLSAALQSVLPEDVEKRGELAETLASFAESTYLHQVVERDKEGKLTHYPDLTFALQHIRKPAAAEWRTHFHVPLFTEHYHGLNSTQQQVAEVLDILRREHICSHLEVETYTWDVLPEELKKDLPESIRRELEWVINHMNHNKNAENRSSGHRRAHEVAHR